MCPRCDDEACPCRDGLACHYEDVDGTKGWPRRCPHSMRADASPKACSLCARFVARRVDQVGGELRIDGDPPRAIDLETPSARVRYGARGKAASMRVTRRKS